LAALSSGFAAVLSAGLAALSAGLAALSAGLAALSAGLAALSAGLAGVAGLAALSAGLAGVAGLAAGVAGFAGVAGLAAGAAFAGAAGAFLVCPSAGDAESANKPESSAVVHNDVSRLKLDRISKALLKLDSSSIFEIGRHNSHSARDTRGLRMLHALLDPGVRHGGV
jgi:hypothetical protein